MDMQELGVHKMKATLARMKKGRTLIYTLSPPPLFIYLIILLAFKRITIHKVPKWYLSLARASPKSIRLLGDACISTSPRKVK